MSDIHGALAQAILKAAHGDTLEWDLADEEERDEMREVAAQFEPSLRQTLARMRRWLDAQAEA